MTPAPGGAQAAHCYQHPTRAGIGICVECRKVVCAECSTQFEGINRCARCLAQLAPKKNARRAFREWGVLSILGALVCGLGLFGGVIAFAEWLHP